MGKTTNFELNLAEGSQYVNPLTNDNPNYEKIDEVMKKNQDNSIQVATELVSGKIHAITCLVTDATFMRFTATGDFRIGDTFTYNGTPVTAFLPDGSGLSDYAYRINSEVLISVVGTRLTVYSYAAGSTTADNALALGGRPPEYYGKATDTFSTYTQSYINNVHNFVGNGANGKVKFVANVKSGDIIQINGVPVTAFAGAQDFIGTYEGEELIGKTLGFFYDSGSQTVNFNGGGGLSAADKEKLIPENIRAGVTIAGVLGSLEPLGDLKVLAISFSVSGGYYNWYVRNRSGSYDVKAVQHEPNGSVIGTVKLVAIIGPTAGTICGHSGQGVYTTDHNNNYQMAGLSGAFVVLGTTE